MSMLGTALRIAASVHEKQTDRGGNAYLLHPIRIMLRLRTNDEELMAMAILHDVVEDSKWTLDMLRGEGISERALDALEALTHPEEEPYEEYIKRVSTNVDAVRIKLEDLRDNSDITRLKGLRKKDFERIEKYHRAYMYLDKIHKAQGEVYG